MAAAAGHGRRHQHYLSGCAGRVVADDFSCAASRAVTEIHLWGSYLTADRHWEQNSPGAVETASYTGSHRLFLRASMTKSKD